MRLDTAVIRRTINEQWRALPHNLKRAAVWLSQQARYHWPLVIVLALYCTATLTLVFNIPEPGYGDATVTAPDEGAHYLFNVKYIVEHNALPISGRDDLPAYHSCTQHHIGIAPCTYSYTVYPGPNYIVSALFVKLFHRLGSAMSSVQAARLTSFLSGIVFILCSYAAVYSITRRRAISTLLVAAVAFIPQFLFVMSYINIDAHSAAISAFLGLCIVKFLQKPRSVAWQMALCIALFGLLPISKYNYFALGLAGLILIGYTFVRQRFTKREIIRFALFAAGSFVLLASFWYIRNIIVYHDPLGQSFMLKTMAHYAQLGTPYPTDFNGLNIANQRDFFTTLFQSFFFALGLMHFYLDSSSYNMLWLLLLLCAGIMVYNYTNKKLRRFDLHTWGFVGLYALIVIGTLLVVLYNSLYYDFQPQGRYMYAILVPTLLLLAYAIRRDNRNTIIAYLLCSGTVYLFIAGISVFMKYYIPYHF